MKTLACTMMNALCRGSNTGKKGKKERERLIMNVFFHQHSHLLPSSLLLYYLQTFELSGAIFARFSFTFCLLIYIKMHNWFIQSFDQYLSLTSQIMGWDQIAQETHVFMAVDDFERSNQQSPWLGSVTTCCQTVSHPDDSADVSVTRRPCGILMSLGLFNIHHQMWPVSVQGYATRSTNQIQTSSHRHFKCNEMREWEQDRYWLWSCYRAASLMNKTSASLTVQDVICLTGWRVDAKSSIICTILLANTLCQRNAC